MKSNGYSCVRGASTLLLLTGILLLSAGTGSRAGTAAEDGGSIWGADYFPNPTLVTQDGKKVRFFDDLIKGRVVVINFIYTSCPDACPLETARLREVQKILGDRVGRDVFMYSITIDPKVDTPKVLKRYAQKFGVEPGWLFLTGKEADITLLRKKLGLYDETQSQKLEDHVLSLIIGNQKTGQWRKVSPYENPYVLATQVGSWLHNWKLPPEKGRGYASAPAVRNISRGESLFRTRCAACHTIGEQQLSGPEKRPGPDLLGVTAKRERGWLSRWLAEPDKVIAEKDPLALALLAEYDNLPMPNLRLNAVEVDALIEYMDEETRRKEPPHRKHEPGHGDHGKHP
jgi:protein SCO1